MGKTYQCPNCGGTEIVWDRGFGKLVCPKDRTPVDSYAAPGLEKSVRTPAKKETAKPKKTARKKTRKRKTTTKQAKRKKKTS
jgi:transcription initiation factor TFIIIB Brf1 subunit/transcription initiation factor TFIIB